MWDPREKVQDTDLAGKNSPYPNPEPHHCIKSQICVNTLTVILHSHRDSASGTGIE